MWKHSTFNFCRIDVALKTAKYDNGQESNQELEIGLLREAEIMSRVCNCNYTQLPLIGELHLILLQWFQVRGHDHVIYLQGIMVDSLNNRFHLVMGLCTNQSLRDFFDENKEEMRIEENDKKKLQWATQVNREQFRYHSPTAFHITDSQCHGLSADKGHRPHGLGDQECSPDPPRWTRQGFRLWPFSCNHWWCWAEVRGT